MYTPMRTAAAYSGVPDKARITLKRTYISEKCLVVKKREDLWEVRSPGAHTPESTHSTMAEAESAAEDFLKRRGGGYLDIIL